MTKYFNKFKKTPVFRPFTVHFSNFEGKKTFLENPALSRTTSYGFLAPCQNLDKTNYIIPRKVTDGRMGGRADSIFQDSSSYWQDSN